MAATGGAVDGRLAGSRAASLALSAFFHAPDLHLLADAEDGLLELEGQVLAEIGAALRARAASAPLLTEHVAESEEIAEDVLEIVEDRPVKPSESLAGAIGNSGVTKTVIAGALLGIGKDRIGLAALLEALFRVRIIGVAVRVILQRELAVGALDLLIG